MKKLIATILSVGLSAALLATSVQAGGPVVVVEEAEPEVKEEAATSKGWLPWLVVPLFLCVVMCGPEDP